jgi:hypothetical protein
VVKTQFSAADADRVGRLCLVLVDGQTVTFMEQNVITDGDEIERLLEQSGPLTVVPTTLPSGTSHNIAIVAANGGTYYAAIIVL